MEGTRRRRTLVHADVDAFFASVEQRDDPRLRDRPMAVASFVVMAAGYEARAYGVRGGMTVCEALRRCPQLVTVEPRGDAYAEASQDLFAVLRDVTPLVEAASMEEAFLDLGDAPDPVGVAERLRARVRDEVGLPLSAGLASTKLLAKVASRAAKPDGLLVVGVDEEDEFRRRLPVDRLWGVGPTTVGRLHAAGIRTVRQLDDVPPDELVRLAGTAMGRRLLGIAAGTDDDVVRPDRPRRSFSVQRSLAAVVPPSPTIARAFEAVVAELAARVGRDGGAGASLQVRVRLLDRTDVVRRRRLAEPVGDAAALTAAAAPLLAEALDLVGPLALNLVAVTVSDLVGPDDAVQLALPLT